jgi:hypothetical protein
MSLDVYLYAEDLDGNLHLVFDYNITHNLTRMARAAGVYEAMWRPDEKGWATAADITPALTEGLQRLTETPLAFESLNPPNGWGSYDGFVCAVRSYLTACQLHPSAVIELSR